jgi:hypothetical protein
MRWLLIAILLVAIGSDICAGLIVDQIAQTDSHWALASFAALCVSLVAALITAFALPAALLLLTRSTYYRWLTRW